MQRKRKSMSGRRLNEWRVHLRHRLAAFLALAGGGTRHGLAALHGFGGRGHARAIDSIGGKRSPEKENEDDSSEAHLYFKLKAKSIEVKKAGEASPAAIRRCYAAP